MSETLSLIICTYRRPEAVGRLLEAIAAQERIPNEVLVVDASLDEATARVVESCQQGWPGPSLVYHSVPPEHRGLTRQRNYGITHSRGEIVAFLDDDTVPEPSYVAEVLGCFGRHPEAVGVGGYITNQIAWRPLKDGERETLSEYHWAGWSRREDVRLRVRRIFGLAPSAPPGWMPSSGHGRSVGSLPPDGQDHPVEFFIGCASNWRRTVFDRHRFSLYFEGYGLYEDLDFCLRAAADGPLFLCTAARLAHYHAPGGRPDAFRYGTMVVRNGWFVWRRRWPRPMLIDRARWWATTSLLALCRLADGVRGPKRRQAFADALGRSWGMLTLLWDRPGKPATLSDPRDATPCTRLIDHEQYTV